MSDRYDQTIGNAAAKVAPALGGATIAGLGPDEWTMLASIATFTYAGIMILLALPKLAAWCRHYWRRLFPKPDDSDQAGA